MVKRFTVLKILRTVWENIFAEVVLTYVTTRALSAERRLSRSLIISFFETTVSNCEINSAFSMPELETVLKGKTGASPGHDKLTYEMIKRLPTPCLVHLLNLLNTLWKAGTCPNSWRHSIVIALRKNDKFSQTSDPTAYRPISLTCVLCKIMERMINNRLRWWLESRNLLHECQSGFRKNRSTKDCIMRLHDSIYKGLANQRSTLAVFLDFEKAYDTVWRHGLLYKLGCLGVRGNMFKWIQSFVSNRTFQVRVGSTLSNTFTLENGIPQGSALSPLLFAIMMNDLPINLNVDINIFADDSCIWETGLDINQLVSNIQSSLQGVVNWCDTWGFRISPSKSAVVLFTKRRKVPTFNLVIGGNNILPVQKEYKYLGVVFDSKLTYRSHSKSVTEKCLKRLNLLRLLCGTDWGGSKACLLIIYRTLIRPKMEYGFEAYLFSPKYILESLQKIQNAALRICCGAMGSTPLFALQHSCREYPIHLRHLQACLRYRSTILSTVNHPCRTLVTPSWHEIFPDSPTFKTFNMLTNVRVFNLFNHATRAVCEEPPWRLPPIRIDLSLTHIVETHPAEVRIRGVELINTDYTDHLKIYTDGTKSTSKCGCAFFIGHPHISKQFTLNKYCSIFTAELYAILESLKWAKGQQYRKIAIFSDSLSSLQAIEGRKIDNHIVKDILATYNQLLHCNCEVTLVWVPAHVGIEGNERADALAKDTTGEEQHLALTKIDANCLTSQFCRKLWESDYQNIKPESLYKTFWPDAIKTQERATVSRKYSRILFRITTGHCGLNYHLHRIGKHENGLCEQCRVDETVEHFILKCPRYDNHRQILLQAITRHGVELELTKIFQNPSTRTMLAEYVILTGRNI